MTHNSLIESYIKLFLNEGAINLEDHTQIESTIRKLSSAMKKRGLDLYNLNFSHSTIVFLRDGASIKDDPMQSNITKPESVHNNVYRKDSAPESTFSKSNFPALGFNPIEALKSNKPYYINKIKKIKIFYEKLGSEGSQAVDFINNIISLRESFIEAGLVVLGAGIFRVVVKLPDNDNFVIKIGLSEKGRRDCESEVRFSMGGSFRKEHIDNFPTIYTHDTSGNYAWYAIEKVKFLSVDTLSDPEILSDMKSHFRYTYKFFTDTNLTSFFSEPILFYAYFSYLFAFDENEIESAQNEYVQKIENMRSQKASSKKAYQVILSKLKSLFGLNSKVVYSAKDLLDKDYESPDKVLVDNVFVKRFQTFMYYAVSTIVSQKGTSDPKIKQLAQWIDAISRMNKTMIRLISDEAKSMLDQAIMTGMKDLHAGNIGFKIADNGKWRIIFTDMDSKT
jgi:hypothetical protein